MQYTIADICQELGVSDRTLRNYMAQAGIEGEVSPSDRRVKLYSESDLETLRAMAPHRGTGRGPAVEVVETQFMSTDTSAMVPWAGGQISAMRWDNPLIQVDAQIAEANQQTQQVWDVVGQAIASRTAAQIQQIVGEQDAAMAALRQQMAVGAAQALQAAVTRGAAPVGEPQDGGEVDA